MQVGEIPGSGDRRGRGGSDDVRAVLLGGHSHLARHRGRHGDGGIDEVIPLAGHGDGVAVLPPNRRRRSISLSLPQLR